MYHITNCRDLIAFANSCVDGFVLIQDELGVTYTPSEFREAVFNSSVGLEYFLGTYDLISC